MELPSSFPRQHSPFLSDLDVPQHTHGNDHQGSSSPFTTFRDFNSSAALDDALSVTANPSAPPTPYSPSFAAQPGSYHNSPLGSDISYIPGNEFPQSSPNPNNFAAGGADQFGDFDISVLPPDYTGGDDYDPTLYDAQGGDSSLFFGTDFMNSLNEQATNQSKNQSSSPSLSTSSLGSNNPGVSVSVTPALDNPMGVYGSGSPYDQGSPASSNGDNNEYQRQQHQNDIARSRGSSISSQPNDFQGSGSFGLEGVRLDGSSNTSQVHSPSWAANSQNQGPQSPPHIYIPGQAPEITHTSPAPSPSLSHQTLSADNANTMLPSGGIGSINIVPATPISAGVAQGVPFQTMNQGRASPAISQPQSWGTQGSPQSLGSQSRGTSPLPRLPQAPPSPYNFPSNAVLTPPPSGGSTSLSINGNHGETGNAMGALHLSRDGSPDRGVDATDGNFLIPMSNPRARSRSETAVRPQLWQMGAGMGTGYDTQANQNQTQGQTSGLQIGVGSFGQQQPPRLNTPHHMSFGPPVSGAMGFDNDRSSMPGSANTNNNFLTPDFALNVGPTDLRRARSESQGHRRNALSADMTPIFADRSGGANASSFYTPSDFARPGDSFLMPGQTTGLSGVGISGGRFGGMGGGAHRRSVSHGGVGHSHSRSLSRERVSLSASPYPSPHASPRVNVSDLPPDVYPYPTNTAYASGNVGTKHDGAAPTVHVMSHDAQGRPLVQSQQPIQVVRQNVTTHATADASQRRRRTEANFICPVPGCGSTFTRHFNLKGHMRSHNEERPFKCKWPGCEKGFARQHDCKRHEQLHLNIRPYTCQGCQRTFARMDALNRHLRSDAGTDCQAQQPILTSETPNNPAAIAAGIGVSNDSSNGNGTGATTGTLNLKTESEASWQPSVSAGSVMV
ncbi:hypothetical protein ACEPAH_8402 [Sanghuangporus vaninii]